MTEKTFANRKNDTTTILFGVISTVALVLAPLIGIICFMVYISWLRTGKHKDAHTFTSETFFAILFSLGIIGVIVLTGFLSVRFYDAYNFIQTEESKVGKDFEYNYAYDITTGLALQNVRSEDGIVLESFRFRHPGGNCGNLDQIRAKNLAKNTVEISLEVEICPIEETSFGKIGYIWDYSYDRYERFFGNIKHYAHNLDPDKPFEIVSMECITQSGLRGEPDVAFGFRVKQADNDPGVTVQSCLLDEYDRYSWDYCYKKIEEKDRLGLLNVQYGGKGETYTLNTKDPFINEICDQKEADYQTITKNVDN